MQTRQWNTATAYSTDDRVIWQGVFYDAVAGSTGVAPGSDSSKWAVSGFPQSEPDGSQRAGRFYEVYGTPAAADVPVWNDTLGRFEFAAGGGGGGGILSHHTHDIAFDTPDLLEGVAVYTPAVGETLLDAWIEVTEAFDDSPSSDVGTFVGSTVGLFGEGSNSLGSADNPAYAGDGVSVGPNRSLVRATSVRAAPAKFTATHPLKVVVSDSGGTDGNPTTATQGAATVHVLILAAP